VGEKVGLFPNGSQYKTQDVAVGLADDSLVQGGEGGKSRLSLDVRFPPSPLPVERSPKDWLLL